MKHTIIMEGTTFYNFDDEEDFNNILYHIKKLDIKYKVEYK